MSHFVTDMMTDMRQVHLMHVLLHVLSLQGMAAAGLAAVLSPQTEQKTRPHVLFIVGATAGRGAVIPPPPTLPPSPSPARLSFY